MRGAARRIGKAQCSDSCSMHSHRQAATGLSVQYRRALAPQDAQRQLQRAGLELAHNAEVMQLHDEPPWLRQDRCIGRFGQP
jgi:hypothetical protein